MSPRADPNRKVEYRRDELVVHIPDTRGVRVSPWGLGNLKLGPDIYTYSKLPGLPQPHGGSCPGATDTCLRVCYAFRVRETPLVWEMWRQNTKRDECPPELPKDAKIVRWHVAGDFDSKEYIRHWWKAALCHPRVRFFGYTRSWRLPEFLPSLEGLRELPNVQLFASVDDSHRGSNHGWPPHGWRWAWLGRPHPLWSRHSAPAYTCPESTGRKTNCQECRYCIDGKHGDVVFPIH